PNNTTTPPPTPPPLPTSKPALAAPAPRHVDEGVVLAPLLRRQRPPASNNRRHDGTLVEKCPIRRAGQVEMQPLILVRRQALPLLVEIGAALGPGANARIGTQLRLKLGKGRIGAVVARVPREQHARVGAGLASRLEVAQGNAGRGPNGVVGRDPRQRVRAGGIGRQRLEQVIVAIAMDLVEANEDRGFAMAAEHVAGGENLERATAVATTNLFAVHLKLSRKVGVDGHELLGQAEIVAGLLLVIG